MDKRVEPWMIRAAKEISRSVGMDYERELSHSVQDQSEWMAEIIAEEYHREYIVTPLKLTKER